MPQGDEAVKKEVLGCLQDAYEALCGVRFESVAWHQHLSEETKDKIAHAVRRIEALSGEKNGKK